MNYFRLFLFVLLLLSGWIVMASVNHTEPPVIECNTGYDVQVKGFPIQSEANLITSYVMTEYGLDYVLLFSAENWAFTKERKHNMSYQRCVSRYDDITQKRIPAKMDKYYNASWVREWKYRCHWHREEFNDWWLCWMSDYYHPEVTNDPRFLTDWKRQVDQCVREKKEGTLFYWWEHRLWHKHRFIINEYNTCNPSETSNE